MKMYPPRVKMTVMTKSRDYIILPVKITGCSREGQLDMDLTIGIILYNIAGCTCLFIYSDMTLHTIN